MLSLTFGYDEGFAAVSDLATDVLTWNYISSKYIIAFCDLQLQYEFVGCGGRVCNENILNQKEQKLVS